MRAYWFDNAEVGALESPRRGGLTTLGRPTPPPRLWPRRIRRLPLPAGRPLLQHPLRIGRRQASLGTELQESRHDHRLPRKDGRHLRRESQVLLPRALTRG
jgi:hypothetical protein